jgi:hypothetical protein
MEGPTYLWIAEDGLSMPLATDMVLHEGASGPDIERTLSNGEELRRVVVRAARRFGAPLAIPHMDLKLEKALPVRSLGVSWSAGSIWATAVPYYPHGYSLQPWSASSGTNVTGPMS